MRSLVIIAFGWLALVSLAACDNSSEALGSYPAVNKSDCLPEAALVDQRGNPFSPASLKGKLALVDFVYTSCTGPCPMLTAKLHDVSKKLGGEMGKSVTILTISLDPENDTPAKLASYAKAQDADVAGWYFVTGKPAQIERVLQSFDLRREKESDGSVTHNVASFLMGPDGHQIRQYNGLEVKAQTVVDDIASHLPRS